MILTKIGTCIEAYDIVIDICLFITERPVFMSCGMPITEDGRIYVDLLAFRLTH